jgi:hypothetical protein
MSGRWVAKLTFACLLLVSYSPSPQGAFAQERSEGPRGTKTTVVGNCLRTTGNINGTPIAYCRHSKDAPYCTTIFANCNKTASTPNGSGVCAAAIPNPNDPRPCP